MAKILQGSVAAVLLVILGAITAVVLFQTRGQLQPAATPNVQATVESQVRATLSVAPTAPVSVAAVATPTSTTAPTAVPTRPGSTATATPSAPIAADRPVVLSGSSTVKTRSFTLAGGNYTVAWRWTLSGKLGYFSGWLKPIDGSAGELFGREIIKESQQGETQIYKVKPGQYYLEVASAGHWVIAIVPQGQDALMALATAPAPAPTQQQPTAAPALPTDWALAFDRIVPVTEPRVYRVYNDAGISRTQVATGMFQRIYFQLQNRQKKSATVTGGEFTLTDAQGRTYESDFQVRQVQANGLSKAFGGASIVPGATVALNLTFDVARDATGLVLHLKGGNDVKVN